MEGEWIIEIDGWLQFLRSRLAFGKWHCDTLAAD